MTTDTNAAVDTTVAPGVPVTKVEVPKIPLADAAAAIAAAFPGLEVRKTDSTTYRIIGTVVDGDVNWKKGLIYVVNTYATGIRIELQLYSPKKSAHLAAFKDEFNQFAGAKIGDETVEQLPFALATRLRVKLPFALGLEKIAENGAAFIALVNETVEAVRAKIVLEPKKEKKPAKVKAEKAEGKAEGKKTAKAKTKKPVAKAAPATADLNPEVAAAVAGLEIPAM